MFCVQESTVVIIVFGIMLIGFAVVLLMYKSAPEIIITPRPQTQTQSEPIRQYPIQPIHPSQLLERPDKIGFIFNGYARYPLFLQRIDKRYYYYIVDDTRNGVVIPLQNPRYIEIYDNEIVNIPEIGGEYTVKIYNKAPIYIPKII